MKKQFLLLLAFAFALPVFSQDNVCESSYMPFQAGLNLEYTTFNHKGKVTGMQEQSVSALDEIDGGFAATIDMKIKDKKGNQTSDGSFKITCQGGTVRMDMSNMIDPAMLKSYESMEVEMVGDDIEFPNNPEPGQQLPDGTMEVKASMGGLGAMTTTIELLNRKVEGFEEVTTPAGTFNCVKISQDTNVRVMGINKGASSISWLAKGVGTVKTENYSQHGKLQSSMELTKLER